MSTETTTTHTKKENKSLKVQLFQCDLQKENSSSHCHIKKIQHMNSHFKSQNFEEGSKSQHNQQNQVLFFGFFLMARGSGNMKCRIENRHLICFWKWKSLVVWDGKNVQKNWKSQNKMQSLKIPFCPWCFPVNFLWNDHNKTISRWCSFFLFPNWGKLNFSSVDNVPKMKERINNIPETQI